MGADFCLCNAAIINPFPGMEHQENDKIKYESRWKRNA